MLNGERYHALNPTLFLILVRIDYDNIGWCTRTIKMDSKACADYNTLLVFLGGGPILLRSALLCSALRQYPLYPRFERQLLIVVIRLAFGSCGIIR